VRERHSFARQSFFLFFVFFFFCFFFFFFSGARKPSPGLSPLVSSDADCRLPPPYRMK